jgi:hypothetical protein
MIFMTLKELQQAAQQLSPEEQLILLETIVQSMKTKQRQKIDRHSLVDQLRECLKRAGQPTPTDEDIEAMQEGRLVEKYLK